MAYSCLLVLHALQLIIPLSQISRQIEIIITESTCFEVAMNCTSPQTCPTHPWKHWSSGSQHQTFWKRKLKGKSLMWESSRPQHNPWENNKWRFSECAIWNCHLRMKLWWSSTNKFSARKLIVFSCCDRGHAWCPPCYRVFLQCPCQWCGSLSIQRLGCCLRQTSIWCISRRSVAALAHFVNKWSIACLFWIVTVLTDYMDPTLGFPIGLGQFRRFCAYQKYKRCRCSLHEFISCVSVELRLLNCNRDDARWSVYVMYHLHKIFLSRSHSSWYVQYNTLNPWLQSSNLSSTKTTVNTFCVHLLYPVYLRKTMQPDYQIGFLSEYIQIEKRHNPEHLQNESHIASTFLFISDCELWFDTLSLSLRNRCRFNE